MLSVQYRLTLDFVLVPDAEPLSFDIPLDILGNLDVNDFTASHYRRGRAMLRHGSAAISHQPLIESGLEPSTVYASRLRAALAVTSCRAPQIEVTAT